MRRSNQPEKPQWTVARVAVVAAFCVPSTACCGLPDLPGVTEKFVRTHCVTCHDGAEAEAGLDLTKLGPDLADSSIQRRWVQIFDRVHDGEMPPADSDRIDPAAVSEFLASTGPWLRDHQHAVDQQIGRVRGRRLTRREIERSLHDLLGIDIPLADQLPEEAKSAGVTTVANGQSMSHFQLARYLAVLDTALDESWRRAFGGDDSYERDFSPEQIARQSPKQRTREPEIREGLAVTWSSGLIFYGRIPATTAPDDGWYQFTIRVSGVKPPESGGVWSTVRTGLCVSSAPLLPWVTSFEATAEPRDIQFEAWLPKGHMLEIRPGDATLKRGRFAGGQVGTGEGESQDLPGIAFHRIRMRRIHHGVDRSGLQRTLFGDLKVSPQTRRQPGLVESASPKSDAARLLRSFAERAFRRPVSDEDLSGFVNMALSAIDEGQDLATALRIGMRAILCSPRFLYVNETPGRLDNEAVATRLSYFLTGAPPDAELRSLAAARSLTRPEVLLAQTDRLIDRDGGKQFITDFAAQWLDLDQIDFTEPDGKLYPGFDSIVQNSMLDETHTFLQSMLQNNLSVKHLIDSDFTFLNSRLARYYGIDGVSGDLLQRFDLKPQHHRGGVLTQGAVLKVTANGSNTSPVIRGVWISERLLGVPIAPPPDNVPAIEPDIRGATTIREQLSRHRQQDSCAVCHVKIDPPGFALENYDPSGRWRDRYLLVTDGRRGQGPEVDPGYRMPDGQEFQSVSGFKSLVVANPRRLAANVAEKMVVYGTGAPISFADRQAIEQIADNVTKQEFGFRSILHAVVTNDIFLSK